MDLKPIRTPFGDYAGWYHPLIRDPIREQKTTAKQRGGHVYDNNDYGHATIANGYTKTRTGAVYPLSLNLDMVPIRMMQMIHDIAFRQSVIETEKTFNDVPFRTAVTKHYGEHYSDGLMPYLKGIAGAESIDSKAMADAKRTSEFLRQNVISAYIGFNPYTAMKHGPTALVLSMREVGIGNFMRAMSQLYMKSEEIGLNNRDFVDKWSEEVGRRQRRWQEAIAGLHKDVMGLGSLREKILEAGSWLVAQSDMISVRPTWLAKFQEVRKEQAERGEDDMRLAIDVANRAVRRAHGSTAITNLPALVRSGGPMHSWLTTLFGFFGTMLQRRVEIMHQLNDVYKLGQAGEIKNAAGAIPSMVTNFMVYYVWPTIVEEYVTGLTTDDRRCWRPRLFFGTMIRLASLFIYIRD